MANRPVYCFLEYPPYVKIVNTEFAFFSGFSLKQKQKCYESLHKSFLEQFPNQKILEISSKSASELGIELSAFNLKMVVGADVFTIENIFQSSKVFENGGPYTAFTDIEFNPLKSLNCQAKAVAVFVGLSKANLLKTALTSEANFLEIVYSIK